jgi:RNA polymerase sigma-70 factor (ECF subfamily)
VSIKRTEVGLSQFHTISFLLQRFYKRHIANGRSPENPSVSEIASAAPFQYRVVRDDRGKNGTEHALIHHVRSTDKVQRFDRGGRLSTESVAKSLAKSKGSFGEVAKPVRQDQIAAEELFVPNMSQLYYAAVRVLRDPQDSEDALQDGLLSAFRHLGQFQGRCQLSTWLQTVVTNAARMRLRKRRRLLNVSIGDDATDEDIRRRGELVADSRPNPEEECAQRELSRMFRERVRYLPPNYRLVVRLCIIEGLMRREAAQKLGISTNTLKARLRRACVLLGKRTDGVDRSIGSRHAHRRRKHV